MGVAEIVAWVTIGGMIAWIARTHWNHQCPGCGFRAMRWVASVQSSAGKRSGYKCTVCMRQYVRAKGGGYVTREDWEGGVRGVVPSARVLERGSDRREIE